MPSRIEITLSPELIDAEGQSLQAKAKHYFGITTDEIRTIHIITIDADLTEEQVTKAQSDIFTNPVTQISSLQPLAVDFDWMIWIGYRPGVRDNAGATAVEAMEDLLGISFKPGEGVYTSKRYCIRGNLLDRDDVDRIAAELLANDIIQQWKIFSTADWDPETGIGIIIPKVLLDHTPTVTAVPIDSDDTLMRISDERNLALNPKDVPTIRQYFLDPEVVARRAEVGLSEPTDIELEYISQARSDH
jgi:phosphoribosylformylglycinamidine (FGAM) synthase PurS component